MLQIASNQNDTFKTLLGLTSAKGLKKAGVLLLSGEKLIREFLRAPHLAIHYEISTTQLKPLPIPVAEHPKLERLQLSAELFAELDILGTHFNLLVLEQPIITTLTTEEVSTYNPKSLEVVMPIGDPGNLGALIRSCEAFAIPRVILTQEAAHPFLPKAIKASAGSVLRLPLARGPALRNFPSSCIALDMDGEPLNEFNWPKTGLLLVGEEGAGLDDRKYKHRLRIPTTGVESLNVVVAASIALAHRVMPKGRNK